jgi:GTP-binding protein YchF
MKVALIGFPFSGKSTVFQLLTNVEPSKKEETMGTIKVPDKRIDKLSEIYNPKKKTYAEFILSDFSVRSSKDSLISPIIKNMIQKTDMLIFVIRNFESLMSSDEKNPLKEYLSLKEDLILSDLVIIDRRLEREKKEKKNPPELDTLKKMHSILEEGKFPLEEDFSIEQLEKMKNYNFLTLKKKIVLINQEEGEINIPKDLQKELTKDKISWFNVSATIEMELNELPKEEQAEFLADYGLKESATTRFVNTVYDSLGLISFLTSGTDEVRAWSIKNGTTAVEAAGKIHSDIQRGFIRAETIAFEEFIKYGSEVECKKAGVYRLEGKTYIVKDGDIINFRFNV